jgi:uncharacterized protein (DUF1499 family)
MHKIAGGGLLLMMMLAAEGSALEPCPRTPNCVSTQATDAHRIEPFRYSGTKEQARERLLAILKAMPRTTINAGDSNAIRAEFTTRIFRFTDDAIFVFDDQSKTVHFRSASRVGRSDLGVNRRRMEEIRAKFRGGV